ncbi:hypothetical protein [Niallia sp. 03133]|uniref:hypothetical protein n=1 Tax=Niallia sp. 03133 TaxID=3458060 RepID=UPI004043EBCD
MSDKKKELQYEGRESAYLDIDRMINEGMSGGHVVQRSTSANIEEARELPKEEPPTTL